MMWDELSSWGKTERKSQNTFTHIINAKMARLSTMILWSMESNHQLMIACICKNTSTGPPRYFFLLQNLILHV